MSITSHGVKGLIGHALKINTPMSNMLAGLALIVDTTLAPGQSEKLDFLGCIPAMKRWLGDRQNAQMIEHNYQVLIELFETSIEIPLTWVDLDKTDLVKRSIAQLPTRRAGLFGEMVADLVNANGNCFDGKAFFATDHEWGKSGVLDNNITFDAAGAIPTSDEAAAAIMKAWEQLLTMKDDRGSAMNEGMTNLTVTCAPALAAAHQTALSANNLDTGAGTRDNPVRGLKAQGITINLVASANLTAASKIQVFNTSPGSAPLVIMPNGKALHTTSKAEGSDFEHDKRAWAFGIDQPVGAGYGLFTDAVQVTYN